jgi:fructosamine-3-kinase
VTGAGFAEQLARLTGCNPISIQAVGGGDLAETCRARLADGRSVIAKRSVNASIEADMLRAIAATGAATPAIVAADATMLVIDELANDGNLARAWDSLGRELARLHQAVGPHYGWASDYAFGQLAIPNGPTEDWPQFWAARRLLVHEAHIDPALARRPVSLAAQLDSRLPARPVAVLLHGDLWRGNVLVSGNRVTGLIDPASYYGHAEVDFAMLGLFSQIDASLFDAYGHLDPGYAERRPIYQLWPALVHLRLFGAGYRPLVERLLTASGA